MADRLAAGCVARPRPRRLTVDEELRTVVAELLGKRWSPEQVAHELRLRFTHQPERQLCTESIYQAIFATDVDFTRPAKRRRRHRRRRVQGLGRRGRLTGMTKIGDRPAEVAGRSAVGHWEGDCIVGAGNRSALTAPLPARPHGVRAVSPCGGPGTTRWSRSSRPIAMSRPGRRSATSSSSVWRNRVSALTSRSECGATSRGPGHPPTVRRTMCPITPSGSDGIPADPDVATLATGNSRSTDVHDYGGVSFCST